MAVNCFDVYLVNLDPTLGSESRETRPCVVIPPEDMNHWIARVIVAPMITAERPYPRRVPVQSAGSAGQIVLDQLRTVDKTRLVRRLGRITRPVQEATLSVLAKMFAP